MAVASACGTWSQWIATGVTIHGALCGARGEPYVASGQNLVCGQPLPEARLGLALRQAREGQGISLRALARKLCRSHSSLVEYERGHRLAPLDIVEAYEIELNVTAGTLVAVREQAHLELYGEDRLHRRTYVLKAGPPPLRQLPSDVGAFTGREVELARLHAIVAEGRVHGGAPVVISAIFGMGGVGKTALAVHLAHQLAPQFPDAQLCVNFHGYEPQQRLSASQALDRCLRDLGVSPEALPADVEERATRYRELLAGKRALIILDNASSAEQVRPLLPGSSTCLVLITSRHSLGGLVVTEGAQVLDLDALAPQEAVQLIRLVVGQGRVNAEPEATEDLARLCGYLPLAVRIAAARLATRAALSIADLVRRLTDEQRRLTELETGDRQLRASLALSYHDLSAAEAGMFRRLGLVDGPEFSAGVAAALTETQPTQAEALLEALVEAHLVEPLPAPGRYRFHDLLRLYARELVRVEESNGDREAAVRRMLEWYLRNAHTADRLLIPGPRRLPLECSDGLVEPCLRTRDGALGWLKTERANLVAATHQAARCGAHSIAWQLPDALFRFFFLCKHWEDWQVTHRVGLSAAREAGNRQAEAWMLNQLGIARYDLRRLEEALACYEDSLMICREIGDRWGEARVLNNIGVVHRELRRPEKAVECHEQSLATCREIGDRWGEGRTLDVVSESHRRLLDFEKAIECCEQALAIRRELGDRYGEALALKSLGVTLESAGRRKAARDCWRNAFTIFVVLGAPEAHDVRTYLAGDGDAGPCAE